MHSFTAAKDSEKARFVTAFDYASGQLVRRLQLQSFLFLYHNKDFTTACNTVHNFVDSIIARALADRGENDSKPTEDGQEKRQHTFLDGLLSSMTDPHRLRSELLNVLQAGRDTTASLLSHVFYIRLAGRMYGLN